MPEDLKTKLSLDEDLVSSPKEALSRAYADRIAMRNKHLKRFGFFLYPYCISLFKSKLWDNHLKSTIVSDKSALEDFNACA